MAGIDVILFLSFFHITVRVSSNGACLTHAMLFKEAVTALKPYAFATACSSMVTGSFLGLAPRKESYLELLFGLFGTHCKDPGFSHTSGPYSDVVNFVASFRSHMLPVLQCFLTSVDGKKT